MAGGWFDEGKEGDLSPRVGCNLSFTSLQSVDMTSNEKRLTTNTQTCLDLQGFTPTNIGTFDVFALHRMHYEAEMSMYLKWGGKKTQSLNDMWQMRWREGRGLHFIRSESWRFEAYLSVLPRYSILRFFIYLFLIRHACVHPIFCAHVIVWSTCGTL